MLRIFGPVAAPLIRNSPASHRNQTGVDCGWPDLATVVSQMIASARRRPAAAACAGTSWFRIVISAPGLVAATTADIVRAGGPGRLTEQGLRDATGHRFRRASDIAETVSVPLARRAAWQPASDSGPEPVSGRLATPQQSTRGGGAGPGPPGGIRRVEANPVSRTAHGHLRYRADVGRRVEAVGRGMRLPLRRPVGVGACVRPDGGA